MSDTAAVARDFLARFQEPMRDLAQDACDLLLSVLPEAQVSADRSNLGFGRGPRLADLVFVLSPHRAHVTIGLARGASLPDPDRLLEGVGRVHRHVKVRSSEDLRRPELRRLLETAAGRQSP
ncbi:MAG: DUF1801 domain-containing protein [Candidatus Dormibacteraeota bacterium]|nr:DUF1801 domain-containing protein [Candidatus Dormibacteraeota bacterium]